MGCRAWCPDERCFMLGNGVWLQLSTMLLLATPGPGPTAQQVPDAGVSAEAEVVVARLQALFAKDPQAAKLAVELYRHTGTIVDVLPEQDFDGAYRGKLHLVPHLPVGADRKHLEWVVGALTDYDDFFADVQRDGPVQYRWKPLDFRFFESVKRRTPSAFAHPWEVSYNVSGSLFLSQAGVRDTLFHEIFHLNDAARGAWTETALTATFQKIVDRCGTKITCLAPYSPDGIIVRGGTYYDFMPDNGVREYGADVARRYYVEHRALQHHEKLGKPFKCIAPENAEAWALVVKEFFGGIDRVPACPQPPSRP